MRAIGVAVAAWVTLATGCAHRTRSVPVMPEGPYRIGREDVLDIAVWRDADLSRTIPVRPDGFISLPMVGEVKAEGKSPAELSEELRERLKPYVQEPRITVIVREVNSGRVFVTGEVAHPGAYPIRGRVSVLQVIALAGGFSDFADTNRIVLIRQGKQGGKIPIRYADLVADDEERAEVYLMPGDTVVVP